MSASKAKAQESATTKSINAPVFSIKDGALELAVWASSDGKFHNFQLSKSYKSGETWKKTNSVSSFEALSASNLYAQAFNKLRDLES